MKFIICIKNVCLSIFFLFTWNLTSQEIIGYVYHEDNPIANVNIVLKNSARGTLTDEKGKFVLKADKGDIIVLSHIAMLTKEVKIQNFKTLKINLVAKSNALEEVTIKTTKKKEPDSFETRFGRIKKRSAGHSIYSFTGEEVKKFTSAELHKALLGRVPGYKLTKDGVLLRQIGFKPKPAIWDIDGVIFEGFPPFIVPETIESVHVITSSAASVLYGTRASGGVIVVNTKKYNDKSKSNKIQHPRLKEISEKDIKLPNNETEIVELIKSSRDSINNLRLMAFFYKEKGNLELALKINRLIMARAPESISSYRDYAMSLLLVDNKKKAWEVYKTLLLAKVESLNKTLFDLVFHDMERLYHSYDMKKFVGNKFLTKKKTVSDYTNETRIIFEWGDQNIEKIDVEIINPKDETIKLQLGANTTRYSLIEEFFIDNNLKGNWQLYISFPEEKELNSFLKVTIYKNWISSKKNPIESKLFSLFDLSHTKYKLMDLKVK